SYISHSTRFIQMMKLFFLLSSLLISIYGSIESFVTVTGKLICPYRTNFIATIRLMESDTTVNDFGVQYVKRASEIKDAFSSVPFDAAAILHDGWLDYEVEPFLQIIHDCIEEKRREEDEEEKVSICVALPIVSTTEAHFPIGDIDLTSTWAVLPFGSRQKECTDYGSLVYAMRGNRLVLLGGIN
ncbi:hypothetical protein PFISCL1PPCAC_10692, partial [Pristionchus fissidentatus]